MNIYFESEYYKKIGFLDSIHRIRYSTICIPTGNI